MKIRKFCLCGIKLERDVCDEDAARIAVNLFRLEHSGFGHGPIDQTGFNRVLRSLARSYHRFKREGAELGPVEEIMVPKSVVDAEIDRLEKLHYRRS